MIYLRTPDLQVARVHGEFGYYIWFRACRNDDNHSKTGKDN